MTCLQGLFLPAVCVNPRSLASAEILKVKPCWANSFASNVDNLILDELMTALGESFNFSFCTLVANLMTAGAIASIVVGMSSPTACITVSSQIIQ